MRKEEQTRLNQVELGRCKHTQFNRMALASMILLVSIACGQIICQDGRPYNGVESRGTNDKSIGVEGANNGGLGGGATRTIYSTRVTSPHQFMHFGKRPSEALASAGIHELPLMQLQQQLKDRQRVQSLNRMIPFLMSIELEHGQTLRALPEESGGSFRFVLPSNNYYNLAYEQQQPQLEQRYSLGGNAQDLQNLQQIQEAILSPIDPQSMNFIQKAKSSKLLSTESSNESSDEGSSISSISSSSNTNSNRNSNNNNILNDEQVDGSFGFQDEGINISTRGFNPNRMLSKPLKPLVSEFLFGPRRSNTFGTFVKKGEPRENLFMHFGK